VGVEVFVFDGDSGVLKREGDLVKGDEGTVFVFIDFEEKIAVAVVDFGGEIDFAGSELAGGREVFDD